MKVSFRGRCNATWMVFGAVLVSLCTGCLDQGLLIRPVSIHPALVEEELSRDSLFAMGKIAIIDLSGVLMNSHQPQLLGKGEHSVSRLAEQLDRARRDRQVKAVILQINSPGGTVTASELIHDEIMYFRKKTGKPVIALMMDVAASGGYFAACACDEIVALPSTITGSIGVIMQLLDISGTMNLMGVKADAITSGIHKDTGSPFREMRPEERELFQGMIDDMYERFVQAVIAGRPKLDESAVRKLADGRVYTAGQALEAGLIDRIANVRETIESVKKRVGLKRARVVVYARPLEYRPNFYAQAPLTNGANSLLHVDWPSWLTDTSPKFLYLWKPGL